MSNKTQLQTNNTNLDALITRVNAAKETAASLPDAGSGGSGGGSVETCTVTMVNNTDDTLDILGMWYDGSSILSYQTPVYDGDTTTKMAIKHSAIVIPTNFSSISVSASYIGPYSLYESINAAYVEIKDNDDITITING